MRIVRAARFLFAMGLRADAVRLLRATVPSTRPRITSRMRDWRSVGARSPMSTPLAAAHGRAAITLDVTTSGPCRANICSRND